MKVMLLRAVVVMVYGEGDVHVLDGSSSEVKEVNELRGAAVYLIRYSPALRSTMKLQESGLVDMPLAGQYSTLRSRSLVSCVFEGGFGVFEYAPVARSSIMRVVPSSHEHTPTDRS